MNARPSSESFLNAPKAYQRQRIPVNTLKPPKKSYPHVLRTANNSFLYNYAGMIDYNPKAIYDAPALKTKN
jgi:hypothetical protein